uniref:Uncharacterized protein n=1 Tax=Cannabis sativa TaxID=3483 RepID=A0A803QPK4_CANSA
MIKRISIPAMHLRYSTDNPYGKASYLVSHIEEPEWDALVRGLRDEPTEGCNPPSNTLHILVLLGDGMSTEGLIFFGFASIPRELMVKFRNFLEETPNVHFLGLSFISYLQRTKRASSSIIQTKRYYFVAIQTFIYLEVGVFLIGYAHFNQIVLGISIHKPKRLVPGGGIHHLIYSQKRESSLLDKPY